MSLVIALRMLGHEKGRSALAIGGITVALLLVFLQLGFYFSVPKGGMLIYNSMRFDILLVSKNYVYQSETSDFPRRRLFQAQSLPEVTEAIGFYQASGEWMDAARGTARDVFVMAYDPHKSVFDVADIDRQSEVLRRPDVVLVDSATRKEFGELKTGRIVEIERRAEEIAGTYRLGTGFVGLGAVITSDLNFTRIFPGRSLAEVNLGLLRLRRGANPDDVAARLRQILPADTMPMTRAELTAREVEYWTTRTSTGLLFGFGAVIAFVVGLVIMNQVLATQILRQLPQYATLKAIGYTDRQLRRIVLVLSSAMATIGYFPALLFALVIYALLRHATLLPIDMTLTRIAMVLGIAWGMSAVSALMSVRVLQRADPVDLF